MGRKKLLSTSLFHHRKLLCFLNLTTVVDSEVQVAPWSLDRFWDQGSALSHMNLIRLTFPI